jgi:hypothetical protein
LPPVLTWLVLREAGRPLSWLLARIAPAVVATAAMSVVVVAVQASVHLSAGAELMVSALSGAVIYGAVVWVMLGRRPPRALLRHPTPMPA